MLWSKILKEEVIVIDRDNLLNILLDRLNLKNDNLIKLFSNSYYIVDIHLLNYLINKFEYKTYVKGKYDCNNIHNEFIVYCNKKLLKLDINSKLLLGLMFFKNIGEDIGHCLNITINSGNEILLVELLKEYRGIYKLDEYLNKFGYNRFELLLLIIGI